jgi:hypothetical protein
VEIEHSQSYTSILDIGKITIFLSEFMREAVKS